MAEAARSTALDSPGAMSASPAFAVRRDQLLQQARQERREWLLREWQAAPQDNRSQVIAATMGGPPALSGSPATLADARSPLALRRVRLLAHAPDRTTSVGSELGSIESESDSGGEQDGEDPRPGLRALLALLRHVEDPERNPLPDDAVARQARLQRAPPPARPSSGVLRTARCVLRVGARSLASRQPSASRWLAPRRSAASRRPLRPPQPSRSLTCPSPWRPPSLYLCHPSCRPPWSA